MFYFYSYPHFFSFFLRVNQSCGCFCEEFFWNFPGFDNPSGKPCIGESVYDHILPWTLTLNPNPKTLPPVAPRNTPLCSARMGGHNQASFSLGWLKHLKKSHWTSLKAFDEKVCPYKIPKRWEEENEISKNKKLTKTTKKTNVSQAPTHKQLTSAHFVAKCVGPPPPSWGSGCGFQREVPEFFWNGFKSAVFWGGKSCATLRGCSPHPASLKRCLVISLG